MGTEQVNSDDCVDTKEEMGGEEILTEATVLDACGESVILPVCDDCIADIEGVKELGDDWTGWERAEVYWDSRFSSSFRTT